MTDAALAEARNFIKSVVDRAGQSPSGDPQLINLCIRLILRIGIARSNPEDLLIADRLLNNENISKVVDLREEIKIISQMANTNATITKGEELTAEEIGWNSVVRINCLEMLNKCYGSDLTVDFSDPFCTDGSHFYWIPNNGNKEIFKTSINGDSNSLSFQMVNKAETEHMISS
jgi:hypothetical protein